MQRQYIKWYSPSLHREMELLAFGERGFPLAVFPTSGGRFFEYEDRGMVNALRPKIDRGELQVICVDSVDQESWYNRSIHPADRLHRQNAFDAYLVNELAPFVRERTSWPQMATTGCSFGGYHAINFALRHPDLVTYAVSMSGAFDMPRRFLDGYYDSMIEVRLNQSDGRLRELFVLFVDPKHPHRGLPATWTEVSHDAIAM